MVSESVLEILALFCCAFSDEKRIPPKAQLFLLHRKQNKSVRKPPAVLKRFCAVSVKFHSCDCVLLTLEVWLARKSGCQISL